MFAHRSPLLEYPINALGTRIPGSHVPVRIQQEQSVILHPWRDDVRCGVFVRLGGLGFFAEH